MCLGGAADFVGGTLPKFGVPRHCGLFVRFDYFCLYSGIHRKGFEDFGR